MVCRAVEGLKERREEKNGSKQKNVEDRQSVLLCMNFSAFGPHSHFNLKDVFATEKCSGSIQGSQCFIEKLQLQGSSHFQLNAVKF